MYKLAIRFSRSAHQITGRIPLDDDALRAHAPPIFAPEAQDNRSDRHVYVPTNVYSAIRMTLIEQPK